MEHADCVTFVPTTADLASLKRRFKRVPPLKHDIAEASQQIGRTFFTKRTTTTAVPSPLPSALPSALPSPANALSPPSLAQERAVPASALSTLYCSTDVESEFETAAACDAAAANAATACDAAAANPRISMGPFSYEAPRIVRVQDAVRGEVAAFVGLAATEVQVLKELVASGWCTPEHLRDDVVGVLDEAKLGIPLRCFDFALTNIAKGRPTLYTVVRSDGTTAMIDPHVSYKNMIASFNRRLFDSFKRQEFVYFTVDGVEHATTVAQLKWAEWVQRDDILTYVRANKDLAQAEMKAVSESRKAERSLTGKRKRQAQLTLATFGGRTVDAT